MNPTIRKPHKNKLLLTLLILLFINALISLKTFATPTKNLTVTSDVYFVLPHGEINFANGQGFNTVYPENSTGEWFWVFDSYKFQVQDANMTVTSYFVNNQLGFTLYGDTGNTSTIKIYVASLGEPNWITVNGARIPVNYNSGTGILTVTITHSSPEEIVVNWSMIPSSIFNDVWLAVGLLALTPLIFASVFLSNLYRKKKRISTTEILNTITLMVIVLIITFVVMLVIDIFTAM